MPSDRGVYTCTFENEVRKTESTMHLKIQRKLNFQPNKKYIYYLSH